MSTTPVNPEINLAEIQKEAAQAVQGMTREQLEAEVLKLSVRKKKQQKKQQGSGAQKSYQLKQRERFKLMKEEAIKLGIWDKINEQAEAQAEAELTAEAGDEADAA
jgi:hypothetical protein